MIATRAKCDAVIFSVPLTLGLQRSRRHVGHDGHGFGHQAHSAQLASGQKLHIYGRYFLQGVANLGGYPRATAHRFGRRGRHVHRAGTPSRPGQHDICIRPVQVA
jgi:hypothetical protein